MAEDGPTEWDHYTAVECEREKAEQGTEDTDYHLALADALADSMVTNIPDPVMRQAMVGNAIVAMGRVRDAEVARLRAELAEAQQERDRFKGQRDATREDAAAIAGERDALEDSCDQVRGWLGIETDEGWLPLAYKRIAMLRWLHAEAAWQRDYAIDILADLADDSPCVHDHHGYCQGHGWLYDSPCPQNRLKVFARGGTAEEGQDA